MTETTPENKIRMEALIELLTRVAGGELSARFVPTDANDEIDALGLGINMLAEEVAAKVGELEKMNKFMVGRELKMVELKNQMKDLEEKCGVTHVETADEPGTV